MNNQDRNDSLILSRHEVAPSGYDLDKLEYKELVFRLWVKRAERVRDTIQGRRMRQ